MVSQTGPTRDSSASGSLTSIQQLASAIGSAAITLIFQSATSGLDHAMKVTSSSYWPPPHSDSRSSP
jgi:hypothetical protein